MSTSQRALVIIDVQNEYLTGNLRIEYPDPQSSLRNIVQAMDVAREHGIPVLVVQNSAPAGSPLFAKGSEGWQLHPEIAARPYDHLLEKTLPSAFAGTALDAWLRERGIDTIAIAGFMTHNCDASTAFDAMHRGYTVEFLSDASGSVPYSNAAGSATAEEIHRVFSVVLHSRFAWTGCTRDWISAALSQRTLSRGSILDSNQVALAARAPQRVPA